MAVMPVAAGRESSYFICNGSVWVTGSNSKGKLGVGDDHIFCHKPVQLDIESNIISVAAGTDFCLLLDEYGRVYKFGTIYMLETTVYYPEMLENLPTIIAIFAAMNGFFLVDAEDKIWICGRNSYGGLGKPVGLHHCQMKKLKHLRKIQQISAGEFHTLFLNNAGQVWSCGDAQNGKLGQGSMQGRERYMLPQIIPDIPPMSMVSAGRSHSMFLDVDGRVWLCGWNFWRDKNNLELDRPEMVEEISRIALIHAANVACFAVDEGGVVYQLGSSFNLNKGTSGK